MRTAIMRFMRSGGAAPRAAAVVLLGRPRNKELLKAGMSCCKHTTGGHARKSAAQVPAVKVVWTAGSVLSAQA